MANYYQPDLDLKIQKDQESAPAESLRIPNSQLNDPNRQGIWLRDVDPKLDEFRKKSRLYTHGGSIHFGVPPEERWCGH